MFFCIKMDPLLYPWGNAKTPRPRKRLITRTDARPLARSWDVGVLLPGVPRALLSCHFLSL